MRLNSQARWLARGASVVIAAVTGIVEMYDAIKDDIPSIRRDTAKSCVQDVSNTVRNIQMLFHGLSYRVGIEASFAACATPRTFSWAERKADEDHNSHASMDEEPEEDGPILEEPGDESTACPLHTRPRSAVKRAAATAPKAPARTQGCQSGGPTSRRPPGRRERASASMRRGTRRTTGSNAMMKALSTTAHDDERIGGRLGSSESGRKRQRPITPAGGVVEAAVRQQACKAKLWHGYADRRRVIPKETPPARLQFTPLDETADPRRLYV
ncbi:hypothetical protein B0H13DRAFT_1867628 [Mycena leptocephala]|nr:hypothetical protein B0H13DRAFT_1867628 [Mycena leptocephala]